MLKTYGLAEAVDFIFFTMEQRQDDLLWDVYLRSEMKQSFGEFKKAQGAKRIRQRQKAKPVTEQEEKARLTWAAQYIKPLET